MSDATAPAGEMAHPIVPVLLGGVVTVGGGYLAYSGSLLAGLIVAAFGAFVFVLGVRRVLRE